MPAVPLAWHVGARNVESACQLASKSTTTRVGVRVPSACAVFNGRSNVSRFFETRGA